MANRIYAVLSALARSAERLKREEGNFSTASKRTKQAADVVTSSWEGDARNAFVREQREVIKYDQEMITLVSDFCAKLNLASRTYEQTDRQGAQIFRRL